ncbi:MAG: bifunctional protein tyrosine phosphatase family protein/NAD(P)/FAD-dependent oxidoreductase [Acetobacteraceae bacterium]|nr:bifunctional protein tyrosine phosphatase family protein/NAD(P)/FAD-dependent oxidoreductase [Acetobacteraceae bacterium]
METLRRLTPALSVAPQLSVADLGGLSALGFHAVINNRPDNEADGQPPSAVLEATARRLGLGYRHIPVVSGTVTDADVAAFDQALRGLRGPVLAFCRTGTRSSTLWSLSQAPHLDPEAILRTAAEAGYDLSGLRSRLEARWTEVQPDGAVGADLPPTSSFDVVVVGGGAAGSSAAASLLRRRTLRIAIIEPRDVHYYQPGWTLVGGGVFSRSQTARPMRGTLPRGVTWLHSAVAAFEPEHNAVVLEDGSRIGYRGLVVVPGLQLQWSAIPGLEDALGRDGVTSNYRFDLAAYTWELVQGMQRGVALFTQPPMPIKCAGAPQKAMYLSCDAWRRRGVLGDVQVAFHSAAPALFGVAAYVPPLMRYVERYGAQLALQSTLKSVDGPGRTAVFETRQPGGDVVQETKSFDMLHVVPPQVAPDFVRTSPLADAAGWVEVSPETLRHPRYGNIFSLGDVCSAPNAKTAAAIRKQAPVVAENVIAVLEGREPRAIYDGYGSCPLTVERGRVVLAEFGYGGKLLPTIPWDSTRPRRSAWLVKTRLLPYLYFDMMLRGREWLARPQMLPDAPAPHAAVDAMPATTTDRRI